MPDANLGIIVVIPCYNEANILATLQSIEGCERAQKRVEVIVVINSAETTDLEVVKNNIQTEAEIKTWLQEERKFQYHIIHEANIPRKKAGVGYARKLGMDEAIWRFATIGNNNGIICSLDADTLVANNYFTQIEQALSSKKHNACSIYFEHDIEGKEFTPAIYRRITEYELHLRYYSNAMLFSGFPYYFYTIGSAFAISAQAYCTQGGMNKKQAGEDFYFLQKIMQMGKFVELNSTAVYPSPRPSDRVIFGTGPIIKEYSQDDSKLFLTYNFKAFEALKQLFDDKMLFFKVKSSYFDHLIAKYHSSLRDFLVSQEFKLAMETINNNIAHEKHFTQKFFHWFNGLRVVKYMNFAHPKYFNKIPVEDSAKTLLELQTGSKLNKTNCKDILMIIRQLDRVRKAFIQK